MKYFFIVFLCTALIISCKDKKQNAASEQPATVTTADPVKDSTEIREVISSFYNWYDKNFAKFQAYDLYSGIRKKDAPPYKINWDEVKKYQQYIHDSVPQLGEEFNMNQKKFFEQCDSAFKVDVEDDIPYGFDFDWFTNSQEDTKYLLDEINKSLPWIITITGDKATVDVKGEYNNDGEKKTETAITIQMKKENGKWKIAKTWMD